MKKNKSKNIIFQKRDLTTKEYLRIKDGFNENALENGAAVQKSERFGYVAMHKEKLIGCSSGLAYKNGMDYSGWFYLTDLFVEKDYRYKKIGQTLLTQLEKELKQKGITKIYTWTAGYEAPGFYKKLGYEVFSEMEGWYSDGSNRVGVKKEL